MKKAALLLFLFLHSGLAFAKTETDTITNWQVYADAKLLFKSNQFHQKLPSAVIKSTHNYERLKISVWHCTHDDKLKKRIDLICNGKIVFTVNGDEKSNTIQIEKVQIDRLRKKYPGVKIHLDYTDATSADTLRLGTIILD